MHIYLDLDNTLIDELGKTVRPSIFELLDNKLAYRYDGGRKLSWCER